jgi:hypothetical protein
MDGNNWYDILKIRREDLHRSPTRVVGGQVIRNITPLPTPTKEQKVKLTYENFKRRNPHFWNEARNLPGNGEVAALDSIVMEYLNETITDKNPTPQERTALWEGLKNVAEGFIFSN